MLLNLLENYLKIILPGSKIRAYFVLLRPIERYSRDDSISNLLKDRVHLLSAIRFDRKRQRYIYTLVVILIACR